MKKILLSILAIALTVGLVSGTAYALFTDTVNVAGITLSSGNADLRIYDGNSLDSANEITSGAVTGLKFENLYPGFRDYGSFTFYNDSKSQISLALTGRLTNANGDWDALKNNIYAAIGTGTKDNPTFLTSWISFNDWNSITPHSLGIPNLAHQTSGVYNIYLYIPAEVGNSIADKEITNVAFEIYATQVQ